MEKQFVDHIKSKEDFHRIMPRVAAMLNQTIGITYSDFYSVVTPSKKP